MITNVFVGCDMCGGAALHDRICLYTNLRLCPACKRQVDESHRKLPPTREEIRVAMDRLHRLHTSANLPDHEKDHREADRLLCEMLLSYGEDRLVEHYRSLGKIYS